MILKQGDSPNNVIICIQISDNSIPSVDQFTNLVGKLKGGLIAAISGVGGRFELGDYCVPEMLVAARSRQAGLTLLMPLLMESGVKSSGKVVISTVKGDLHDIGKNLVAMLLEGASVTQEYANKIGADGFALDASRAVALGQQLQ